MSADVEEFTAYSVRSGWGRSQLPAFREGMTDEEWLLLAGYERKGTRVFGLEVADFGVLHHRRLDGPGWLVEVGNSSNGDYIVLDDLESLLALLALLARIAQASFLTCLDVHALIALATALTERKAQEERVEMYASPRLRPRR